MSKNVQKKPKKLIIIGAGGHARVIADIIKCTGDEVMGFLDDRNPAEFPDLKILGRIDDAKTLHTDEVQFIVGIGKNETRKEIVLRLGALSYYTAIHPSAIIADDVVICEGTVVMANAAINTGSYIGRHCIINTSAVIEHDNMIDNYVHISPHATLCGTVSIGSLSHIGAGVTVRNNTDICEKCIIGMGAVVIRSIHLTGTYIGVPARRLE